VHHLGEEALHRMRRSCLREGVRAVHAEPVLDALRVESSAWVRHPVDAVRSDVTCGAAHHTTVVARTC